MNAKQRREAREYAKTLRTSMDNFINEFIDDEDIDELEDCIGDIVDGLDALIDKLEDPEEKAKRTFYGKLKDRLEPFG